ncbi:MAG: hypothetical protein V1867_03205 [Candidatus Falkowbacteria bacterium]
MTEKGRYLRKPNVRPARVKFPWEKDVIEEKDFRGTIGEEDDCGCRSGCHFGYYTGVVPEHMALGSVDNWPEECLDSDGRPYGSPSEYRGPWVPLEERVGSCGDDDDWDDIYPTATDYTAKELGPDCIREAARELLLTIGYDPKRFGEPEKARLMILAAKVYVEKSLDRRTSGFDALIALYHQTADDDGTVFLHSFIPALCRGIRDWMESQKGKKIPPKVSVQAERFLLYQAKAEEVRGDPVDLILLGRAIYGDREFYDLLRRVKTPAKKRLVAA